MSGQRRSSTMTRRVANRVRASREKRLPVRSCLEVVSAIDALSMVP